MNDILRLGEVIARQQAELVEQLSSIKLIDRDIGTLQVQEIFKNGPGIVVIQGVRRCGKSIYSTSCFEQDYIYVNFDDERLNAVKANELESILEACYQVKGKSLRNFIFDEIQLVEGWEPFISRLGRSKNVIVTGSNAKLLSSELATRLTGRYIPLKLYPFSFSEFIRSKGVSFSENPWQLATSDSGHLRQMLLDYIDLGGFPDVSKYGQQYPQSVYADIIQKDILVRHKIKNHVKFKEFAKVIVSNFSQELSITKVGKVVGIESPNTASKYSHYLQDTYLAFSLNRYFHKLKGQLVSNKKYYAIDSGIIKSIAYTPTANFGALLENIVYLELLRQRDYHQLFDEIFFWQTESAEVDFLLRQNKKSLAAIQVCADLSNPLTREREVRALIKIANEMKPEKLLIVTEGQQEELIVEGTKIEVWPLAKWLLDPKRSLA
jgi:predicted AAA+ superfamily ATPase